MKHFTATVVMFFVCKAVFAQAEPRFVLPDSLKSNLVARSIYSGDGLSFKIDVTVTSIDKIWPQFDLYLSQVSDIPRKNFTSQLEFKLPTDTTEYRLPIDDRSFTEDWERIEAYHKLSFAPMINVRLTIRSYKKWINNKAHDIWLIEGMEVKPAGVK